MKNEKLLLFLVLTVFSSMALARITDQEFWTPVARITAKNGLEAIRLCNAQDSNGTNINNGAELLSGTNGMGNPFWLIASTNSPAIRYGEHVSAENGLPSRFCMAVFDSEGQQLEFAGTTNTIENIISGANASGVYMKFRRPGVPSYFTFVIFSQVGPCSDNRKMFLPLGLTSVDSFYMTEEAVANAELAVLVDGNGALAERLSKYYVVCEQNKPMEMAWLHIGAVLGNDVCRNNLAFIKEHHGATEKAMFHFLPEEIGWYGQRHSKNPDDVVAMFFLFKSYESSGDRENAIKYADRLRENIIHDLLLPTLKHDAK